MVVEVLVWLPFGGEEDGILWVVLFTYFAAPAPSFELGAESKTSRKEGKDEAFCHPLTLY